MLFGPFTKNNVFIAFWLHVTFQLLLWEEFNNSFVFNYFIYYFTLTMKLTISRISWIMVMVIGGRFASCDLRLRLVQLEILQRARKRVVATTSAAQLSGASTWEWDQHQHQSAIEKVRNSHDMDFYSSLPIQGPF